jgi:hypothetical protein
MQANLFPVNLNEIEGQEVEEEMKKRTGDWDMENRGKRERWLRCD